MKLSLEGGLGVIDIYGYYLLVVEWLRGIRMQRNIDVFDSFQRMKEIKLSFTKIHIRHIYWEHNHDPNKLVEKIQALSF